VYVCITPYGLDNARNVNGEGLLAWHVNDFNFADRAQELVHPCKRVKTSAGEKGRPRGREGEEGWEKGREGGKGGREGKREEGGRQAGGERGREREREGEREGGRARARERQELDVREIQLHLNNKYLTHKLARMHMRVQKHSHIHVHAWKRILRYTKP